jgi:aspartate kinase
MTPMRLVVKFGGTSLATPKHIKSVAKFIQNTAKKNQIVMVCSAINDTTDELLEISEAIKKENKVQVDSLLGKITKQHKQIGKDTITNGVIRKHLFEKLDEDLSELGGLIHGMVLLGEVTAQSLDYLISFGERLSVEIVSHALLDLKSKSVALTGKEVGIVTDSNFGQSKPLMDTTRLRVSTSLEPLLSKKFIPVIGGFAGADQHGIRLHRYYHCVMHQGRRGLADE